MAHGDFVWCDLSARNVDKACKFYAELLGWNYHSDTAPDGSRYLSAYKSQPIAGLYQMPRKFEDMGMPCFWMSYIQVDSVEKSVALANELGAKVEVAPIEAAAGSIIALIRDPLGAGFTVIEGKDLRARSDQPSHGEMAWNELYVSDAKAVIPFYEALFGWRVSSSYSDSCRLEVKIGNAARAAISELPDNVRGKEQYWGVHFAVDDLVEAKSQPSKDGSIEFGGDDTLLLRDPDGAAFFLTNAT